MWTHVGGPRGLLGAQVWLLVSEQSFGSLFPTHPCASSAHRSWEGLRGGGLSWVGGSEGWAGSMGGALGWELGDLSLLGGPKLLLP